MKTTLFAFLILTSNAVHADTILCRYYGSNYPAVKINEKDLEVGQCPITLPSNLKDFEYRISRHENSGLLRVVIKNKKTNFWMRALGGNNEVAVSLGLSESEGKDVANQVGLKGSQVDEITINCLPSMGRDDDSFFTVVKAPEHCN